jgi:hypothetical protein
MSGGNGPLELLLDFKLTNYEKSERNKELIVHE